MSKDVQSNPVDLSDHRILHLDELGLLLHRCENVLDRFNIHVPTNTLELISVIDEVHCCPHTRIHDVSLHDLINWELTNTRLSPRSPILLTYVLPLPAK